MGDADITLRHIARNHPEGLIAPLRALGDVEALRWEDTQLTAMAVERRLDKVLTLRVNGQLRALIVEFEYELRSTMGARIDRLEAMLSIPGALSPVFVTPPPIATLVVVLSGRRREWPRQIGHRTGWPELGYSGIHYQVDAVYQRTVAELRARGSVLWLVFTPLARDATAAAIQGVIKELKERVADLAELGEMFAAMLVLAGIDPWGYHLAEEIEAMIEDESVDLVTVSSTLRKVFEKGKWEGNAEGRREGVEEGRREGVEEGRREGVEEGRREGVEEGRREGVERMLGRLFMRRMGRSLTAAEQRALSSRVETSGPEEVEDHAFSLEGERLAAWLLGSTAA